MNVCPECRAGKRFIETERRGSASLLRITLVHECLRCGEEAVEKVEI